MILRSSVNVHVLVIGMMAYYEHDVCNHYQIHYTRSHNFFAITMITSEGVTYHQLFTFMKMIRHTTKK